MWLVTDMRDVVGKPRKLLAGRRRGDGLGVVSAISLKCASAGESVYAARFCNFGAQGEAKYISQLHMC
jgi:hypothetical protein